MNRLLGFRFCLLIFCCSLLIHSSVLAQLTVNTALTPAQLVSFLTGPGVTISNITYTGANVARGQFTATGTNLGLASGIMLSTANCALTIGPNTFPDASEELNEPGDPVLDALTGVPTFDAAILEFDFIPQNDTVSFRYVFASEEYPEFVCSVFNDAFAFRITGPGYATPTNIALIPGTASPVAINSVNIGSAGSNGPFAPTCDTSNAVYYVDNTNGATIEMDGFTVPLTASAIVVPCQTYHMRISIADAGDGQWDSSVFFEAGSLSSTPVVNAGADRSFCTSGTTQLGNVGTSGWGYSWSPATGLSSSTLPNPVLTYSTSSPGVTDYIVTATNGSCVLRDTVRITVSAAPTATFNVSNVCFGQVVTFNYTGNAPSSAAYAWNFAGGSVVTGSGSGPYTVNYPVGSYTPTLQVSVGQCVSSLQQQPLSVYSLPTASTPVIQPVACYQGSNGSITYSPQGGQSPYQYSWTPAVSAGSAATSLAAGVYAVTITDAHGCTATGSATLTQPSLLSAASNAVSSPCAGATSGSVSASATGGTAPYTYAWTPGNATTSAISNLNTGNYTCTITDANGCTVTTASSVIQPAALVASVTTNNPLCAGASTGTISVNTQGGTTPYSYSWSPNGSTSALLSGLSTGNYTCLITDANGCTQSVSASIVQPAPLTATANGSAPACAAIPSGLLSANIQGGTSPYAYLWSPAGGTASNATGMVSGTYTCTITDANGCTTTVSAAVPLQHYLQTQITASPVAVCPNQIVTLTASGGNTFLWSVGDTLRTIQVRPAQSQSYHVVVSDTNGCTARDTIVIQVYDLPQAIASSDSVCPGSPNHFFNQSTISSGTIQTFQWSFGDGSTSSSLQPSHLFSQAGIYPVMLTATSNHNCTDTAICFAKVWSPPVAAVTSGPHEGCVPLAVDFFQNAVSSEGIIDSYVWRFPGMANSLDQNPSVIYSTPGTFSVSLAVRSDKGCTDDTLLQDYVKVYALPVAGFSIHPPSATELVPLIDFYDASSGAVSWFWDLGDGTTSTSSNPSHSYAQPGIYSVLQVVTTTYGCVDSIIHTLEIGKEYAFWIPNAFTPNGDGINDDFQIKGFNFTDFRLDIFDRWGADIFTSTDAGVSWDGTFKGRECQADVYDYKVSYKDVFGKAHLSYGKVTLAR